MSVFSTESSKHISSGEGGFICTNDENLAVKARKFAGLGYSTLKSTEGRPKLDKEIFRNPNFKRHDMLGMNYRMPQLCIDDLIPQVQDIEAIVGARKMNAQEIDRVLSKSKYFKAQKNLTGDNAYWTYATSYSGPISWVEFYNRYRSNGGEGFYGCYSLPYQEPVMHGYMYRANCPVAERLQPTLMQFPTNYKTMEEISKNVIALRRTVESLNE
jgi:perosamine synthetase